WVPTASNWAQHPRVPEMTSYVFSEYLLGSPGRGRLSGRVSLNPHPSELMLIMDGDPRNAYGGDGLLTVWEHQDYHSWPAAQQYFDDDDWFSVGEYYAWNLGDGVMGSLATNGRPSQWEMPRHGKSVNAGFTDGHVESTSQTIEGMRDIYLSRMKNVPD